MFNTGMGHIWPDHIHEISQRADMVTLTWVTNGRTNHSNWPVKIKSLEQTIQEIEAARND